MSGLETALGGLGNALSEMVTGVMAWQVHIATGCEKDAALSYVKRVMLDTYGAVTPSAVTSFQIIAEAVELAGGENGDQ